MCEYEVGYEILVRRSILGVRTGAQVVGGGSLNIIRVKIYFIYELECTIPLFINNTSMYVTLQSSTCFEHQHAHHQEDKLYYHSIWYRQSL